MRWEKITNILLNYCEIVIIVKKIAKIVMLLSNITTDILRKRVN